MATFNSHGPCQKKWKFVATFFIFFVATISIFADETQNKIFAVRAEKEFYRAQTQWLDNTNDLTAAWQFARACYDWADFAQSDDQRAEIATLGIKACREAIGRDSKVAAAHYYLAMDLGQLARTKLLGALKIVREMESEFLTAENLDVQFDFAGPARNLGLLYREAPSIGSIGSKRKARKWLQRAAQLAPDYPENYLNLIEAYLKWDDRAAAQLELNSLNALWPKAKKQFTSVAWESSWDDWNMRREKIEKELDEK